jgi:hypothetical protein
LVFDWLTGNKTLNALAPFAAFAMLVFGVLGASVFSLGVMFSYLIAIFTDKPVRRGMFGRVIFDPPLDYSFGWMGIFFAGAGIMVSIAAFVLTLQGVGLAQLWLWYLLSALLVMVGVQLGVAYVVIRVLDELTRRHATAQRDLIESEVDTEMGNALRVPANAQ